MALLHIREDASQGHRNGKISPPALGLHAAVFTSVPLRADSDRERRQRLAIHGCELLAEIHALPLQSADFGDVHARRSEEHTSELQSRPHLVCRLLLEKKKNDEHYGECNSASE